MGWDEQGKGSKERIMFKKYKVAAENGRRRGNTAGEEIGGIKEATRHQVSVCRQYIYTSKTLHVTMVIVENKDLFFLLSSFTLIGVCESHQQIS